MRDLNYQLKQLCQHNRDGSYGTQASRAWLLSLMANQLHELGYRGMGASSLKPKHVHALVERWKSDGVSIGTIKNRMSVLRWWASKVNRRNVIRKDNTVYRIGTRKYVTNYSKSQELDMEKLEQIKDPHIRLSLRLQAAFGLRREEAIKFQPRYAIQNGYIKLKSSWCKGGRPRTVAITSDEQRALLDDVEALAKGGSLIPAHLSYIQHLRRYERITRDLGLKKLHGLRHGYAQKRFLELTGFECPARGGPASRELTPEQRALNEKARALISLALGHSREQISAVYLGR